VQAASSLPIGPYGSGTATDLILEDSMTFSIVAWDEPTQSCGVAVTTKFFGVGTICPFAASGIGAVATQALVNPTFGRRGLNLLKEGLNVQDVLAVLLNSDEGREYRQVHLVDRHGNTAAYTGAETIEWSGHRIYSGFSVAGNMLVGEATLFATAAAYKANIYQPLPERLLRALEAGQAAGGDKRGRQSAALHIVTTEIYPYLDIRVDDHSDPVVELRRLFEVAKQEYLPVLQFLPTAAQPSGVYDWKLIEEIAYVAPASSR
jgi:uncharacterized Ntn-hydrolase superfamily protein